MLSLVAYQVSINDGQCSPRRSVVVSFVYCNLMGTWQVVSMPNYAITFDWIDSDRKQIFLIGSELNLTHELILNPRTL